jgi:hypothetical protein
MDKTIKNPADDFMEVTGGSLTVLSADGKPVGDPVVIGAEPCVVGRGAHCHVVVRDPAMSEMLTCPLCGDDAPADAP